MLEIGVKSYVLHSMLLVFVSVVLYFMGIYIYRKWRVSKELPGIKTRLFEILGDVNNFQKIMTQRFSDCKNAYVLQTFSGYAQLFRKEMLFSFWISYVPFVFVVKAQAVEELIAGTKHLEKSWTYRWLHSWLHTGLLTSYGQKWKSRRKLITPCFHFEILKDFLPIINEKSQFLVETLREYTNKDWTDIMNATHPLYAGCHMWVSSTIMLRLSNPAYFSDFIFYNSKLGRQYRQDVKKLHDFTRSVIQEKKKKLLNGKVSTSSNKRKALIDRLLEYHLVDQNLTEEDIREEVDTFTFAGHDTTAVGLSWALYAIGLYKDIQDRIQEELDQIFGDDCERPVTEDDLRGMEYLDRVLKESQRVYPSVPLIGRKARDDTVLNGFKIPENTVCLVFIYELHRDPEVFPNPEKFDPDRFLPENSADRHPYAYIPFSAGPRNCIGQRFAVMEEKVIIANILRNYTLESLEPRDKVLPSPELILRNPKPFKIRFRKRTR